MQSIYAKRSFCFSTVSSIHVEHSGSLVCAAPCRASARNEFSIREARILIQALNPRAFPSMQKGSWIAEYPSRHGIERTGRAAVLIVCLRTKCKSRRLETVNHSRRKRKAFCFCMISRPSTESSLQYCSVSISQPIPRYVSWPSTNVYRPIPGESSALQCRAIS